MKSDQQITATLGCGILFIIVSCIAEVISLRPENSVANIIGKSNTLDVTMASAAKSTTTLKIPTEHPPVHVYFVNGDNGTCIMMQCGILFDVPYKKQNKQEASKTIRVPEQVSYNGSCNDPNNTQDVLISFYEGWNLRLTFSTDNNGGNVKFYLSEIQLTANMTKELFPDIEKPIYKQDLKHFFGTDTIKASEEGSYKCADEISFAIDDGFVMKTYNLQYAAFQTNISSFSDADLSQCSDDFDTDLYIPIAVGSALAALIMIVLIAYIIGRRCEAKEEYNSM